MGSELQSSAIFRESDYLRQPDSHGTCISCATSQQNQQVATRTDQENVLASRHKSEAKPCIYSEAANMRRVQESRSVSRLAAGAVLLLFFASRLFAQSATGTILGSTLDSLGAAIP